MKKTLWVAALCLFSTAPVLAMSCDNPINAYDRTYCAASEMIQLDQNLNQQYSKTMKSLTKEQSSLVKKAQINWIRERDTDCSSAGSISVVCVNDKMKTRIATLSQIERECKASGCTNALLSKD